MHTLQKKFTEKEVVWLAICSSKKGKQGYYEAAEWEKIVEKEGMGASAVATRFALRIPLLQPLKGN